MHIRCGTQGPDGRRSEAERGALPSLRVVTWACCGTAVAAIVAVAALAASAAPSGSGATPVSHSAGKGPPCNYYYEWNGKVRFPLQSDPHATYTYLAASSEAAKDGVGFLVRGQFVHSAWTSWLTYGRGAKPFSGANFVDNFPAGTDDPVEADPGSVDPFGWRQPMLATPRNFTLLFTPRGYRLSAVAPVLDGTAKTDVPDPNVKRYPRGVKFWVLANRNYQALPGYNPGGTRKRTFPVTTAVDLKTGKAVDCQKYNQLPTRLQRSPENPPSKRNYGRVPVRIALKNGSRLVVRGGMSGSHSQYAPKNPPGLVQFSRAPLGPGADVAEVPPPDNCSGYLATRSSTRRISLVRIPHIANYTNTQRVRSSTLFPNPVAQPWQATYMSFSLYGASSGFYLPGSPNTMSVANRQFRIDRTGGATVLIWPRNLAKRERRHVLSYARKQRWAIVRGGTAGRQTTANVLVRIKGAASDYYGATSKVPCFFDPRKNRRKPWTAIPVERGSRWVATAKTLGAGAPQGVTCRSIRALRSGRCLRRLKRHITATGGSYFARPGHR